MISFWNDLNNALNTSDHQACSSAIITRGKIRMANWFCIVAIVIVSLYLPVYFTISTLVGVFGLIGISILIWCINQLNKKRDPATIFKPVFSVLLFFVLSSMVFQTPINPLGYILWSLLIIASSTFLIDQRWAIGYFILTLFSFALVCYFHDKGFNLRESITNLPFYDNSKLNILSPIKFGIPLLALFIVILEFVRIGKDTDNELLENLNEKEGLLQRITEKEKDLESILNSTGEAIYALNKNGHIVFANAEFEKLTGYANSELEGIDVHFLIAEEYREKRMKSIESQLKEKNNIAYDQFPIKNKNGKIIWIGQSTNLFFDKDGSLLRGVCTARDVSKQKAIEENLILAKEKAEEASLAKERFLSSMSHEIRTPMNAIIGMIDLMKLDEKNREAIESLKISSHNLLGLVNNILDYHELDEGKLKLQKTDFDLNHLLQVLQKSMAEKASEKEIELVFNIGKNIPNSIHGDSLRISQILYNLIHNAIKFTNKGRVTVDVYSRQINAKITEIQFSIIDTGIGIPISNQRTIVDEFKQVNNSTIREGAGLGLAISNKLIELHDSKLQIESKLGSGSKFSFVIPFKNKNQELSKSMNPTSGMFDTKEKPLDGNHILLVEDNLINQKITYKMLIGWGATVEIAENGKISVEKVEESDFDLVLMDLQMPIMNGIEATKIIRAKGGRFEELPIIALTASAVLKIKEEALAAGLDYFITKPFRPNFLLDQIKSHLEIAQLAHVG